MSPESETRCQAAGVDHWIAEARAGSRIALDRLLGTFRLYLLATADQELNPALRVRVSPSDLVQDTLMEAFRDYAHFQGGSEQELLAWMRQILHRNLANQYRRHVQTAKRSIKREVSLSEGALAQLRDIGHDGVKSPSAILQARERYEELERALRQLPHHYRQSLLLHTCEELTFAQVGQRLNCSAEAARKLWGRAAEEMIKLLGDGS